MTCNGLSGERELSTGYPSATCRKTPSEASKQQYSLKVPKNHTRLTSPLRIESTKSAKDTSPFTELRTRSRSSDGMVSPTPNTSAAPAGRGRSAAEISESAPCLMACRLEQVEEDAWDDVFEGAVEAEGVMKAFVWLADGNIAAGSLDKQSIGAWLLFARERADWT